MMFKWCRKNLVPSRKNHAGIASSPVAVGQSLSNIQKRSISVIQLDIFEWSVLGLVLDNRGTSRMLCSDHNSAAVIR